VFQGQTDYTQPVLSPVFDLFFEGLAANYTTLDPTSFYEETETTLTFTPTEQVLQNNELVRGYVAWTPETPHLFNEKVAITIQAQDRIPLNTLVHELLHTIQIFQRLAKDDQPHSYPENWFIQASTTPKTSLEFLIRQYVTNNYQP